ncbi:MAG: shikimate kinase, partial [Planctomyces sp.]
VIKTHSALIALVASPTDLYNRIRRRKNRPLINNEENPQQKLEDLWQQRESAYMDSHHQIDTTGKSVNIVSTEIMKALGIKKPKVQEQAVVIPRENFCYKIYFKDLNRINLSSLSPGKKILIVSQEPVAKHYLDILDLKRAVIVAVAGMTWYDIWVDRDEFEIETQRQRAIEFMECVFADQKPAWDGSESTYEAVR